MTTINIQKSDSTFVQFFYDCGNKIAEIYHIVVDKIIEIANRIFKYCGCYNEPEFQLNPRQCLFLEKFKLHPEEFRIPNHPPLGYQRIVNAPNIVPREILAEAVVVKKHDQYLEELKTFMHGFSESLSRSLFEKHGRAIVNLIQTASIGIPEQIKSIVEWVTELGDKTHKPLFRKMKENNRSKYWTSEMKAFLGWARTGAAADLYSKLLTDVPRKIKTKHPQEIKNLEDHTKVVLGVLFNPDTTSMSDVFMNRTLEPHVIENVFQTTILLIFENKVNTLLNQINDILQKRLPIIVEEMLNNNLVKVADLMTTRICDLLQNIGEEKPNVENANYIKMFDSIIQKVNDQAVAFIETEAATKSTTVDDKFLARFRETNVCHDMIRAKILPKDYDNNVSLEEYFKKLDHVIYTEITKKVIEIIMPPIEKTTNGKAEMVDGAITIINNVEFPPLFYELLKDIKKIAFEITTPQTADLAEKVKEPLLSLLEKFTLTNLQSLVHDGICSSLKTMVKLISNRSELDRFLGDTMLPIVNEKLLYILATETVKASLGEVVPLFSNLVNDGNRPLAIDRLTQLIYEKSKKNVAQFDFTEITLESFTVTVLPLITEIEKLLQYEKCAPERQHPLVAPEIHAIIKNYYTSHYKADNPLYAQLIMNIVFRIGNFGKFTETLLGIPSLQNLISSSIVSSLKKIRTTPNDSVLGLINVMKRRYKNDQDFANLFSINDNLETLEAREVFILNSLQDLGIEPEESFGNREIKAKFHVLNIQKKEVQDKISELRRLKEQEPELQRAQKEKMHREMEKTARLAYDLVIFNLSGAAIMAKPFLGTDASHLFKVMITCYEKFFGNPLLTQNLLFQIQDVVFGVLNESSLRAKISEQGVH